MVRLRLILVSYRCLYLENNFECYDIIVQLDLTSSRVDSDICNISLQRLLLHYAPALFNYCSMRELVILLVIY